MSRGQACKRRVNIRRIESEMAFVNEGQGGVAIPEEGFGISQTPATERARHWSRMSFLNEFDLGHATF